MDTWSNDETKAEYISPIAQLIWNYYTFKNKNVTFTYSVIDPDTGKDLSTHKNVLEVFRKFKTLTEKIIKDNHAEMKFPPLDKIVDSESFHENLESII